MIGEKHELKVEGDSKRRGNNGKRSRHGHGCPSPRDKKLPPVHGAQRTKGCGRGRKSDGVTEIFRCHPHLGLENNKQNFIFNACRDWKPMEMFLDVVGDMGVTGKSDNASCSCVQYSLKRRKPGLRKTDQLRITIVNPGADKCVDNGGENRNRYSFANGSQTPQLELNLMGNVVKHSQSVV